MKKKLVKLFAVLGCCCVMATSAGAQNIPEQFNYQGSLTDTNGQPMADGTYSIEFRLWDAPTDGAVVWGETYTLSVSKGQLNVTLGANGLPLACVAAATCATPLSSTLGGAFAGGNRYLGITVLTGSYPSEFMPRQQILSVPFAMNADQSGNTQLVKGRDLAQEKDTLQAAVNGLTQVSQGSSYLRIGDMQICWGVATFTGTNHIRSFSFSFPATYAAPPTVTNGINAAGSGYNFSIYSHSVSTTGYSGNLAESQYRSSNVPVVMNYMAIGRWR